MTDSAKNQYDESDPDMEPQPTVDVVGYDPVVMESIRLASRSKTPDQIVEALKELGMEREDVRGIAEASVVAMQVIATDSESVNMSDPDKLVNCLVARYVEEEVAMKIARTFPVILREELEASREDIDAVDKKKGGCGSAAALILLAAGLATTAAVVAIV